MDDEEKTGGSPPEEEDPTEEILARDSGTEEDSADGEEPTDPGGGDEKERIQLIYIGPSLTYGGLRTSQILQGTRAEIDAYMAQIVEKWPEASRLLSTPEDLPEMLRKVKDRSSVYHKYYEDMLARTRDSRKR